MSYHKILPQVLFLPIHEVWPEIFFLKLRKMDKWEWHEPHYLYTKGKWQTVEAPFLLLVLPFSTSTKYMIRITILLDSLICFFSPFCNFLAVFNIILYLFAKKSNLKPVLFTVHPSKILYI